LAVFISYSFQDPHKFQDVCFAFESANIKFWNSDEIAAGQSLRDALRTNIRRCTACVLIATPNSLDSAWCQAELGAFWGIGQPVIVYLADESLSEDKLPKQFHGDKFARTIREVVTAVKARDGEVSNASEQPESLPVEAVLSLAVEAFLNRLTYRFKTVWFTGFGSLPGLLDKSSSTLRSANAFGTEVSYDTGRPGEEAEPELKALVAQIVNVRRKKEREIREGLLGLFMEVQGQSQSISHHLAGNSLSRRDTCRTVAPGAGDSVAALEGKEQGFRVFRRTRACASAPFPGAAPGL
jgi:TIR domain-containing protein